MQIQEGGHEEDYDLFVILFAVHTPEYLVGHILNNPVLVLVVVETIAIHYTTLDYTRLHDTTVNVRK